MTNSETVSKKVGRPKAFEDWELKFVDQYCDAKTERGRQNWLYGQRAIGELIISHPGRYRFLPTENDVMLRKAHLPQVLLTELGRLQPTDMHRLAAEIDKRNLSERDATKFVKQFRTGSKKRSFSQFELVKRISEAIDRYCEYHACTNRQLAISLQSVLEIVSENAEVC